MKLRLNSLFTQLKGLSFSNKVLFSLEASTCSKANFSRDIVGYIYQRSEYKKNYDMEGSVHYSLYNYFKKRLSFKNIKP